MGRRVLTLADLAKRCMTEMELKTWPDRHEQLKQMGLRRDPLVAEIYKLGSPDVYLLGQNTGVPAPAVIALPDRRHGQLTLREVGIAKRTRR